MDKIFSPIKSRIIQFIDYKGITKENFYKKTEISASNFKSSGAKSELGGEKIVKILSKYPEINPSWLMMGEGEMIIGSDSDQQIKNYSLKTDFKTDNQSIPLYDLEATAGMVSLFEDTNSTQPIDYLSIPNLPKCDGAIFVTGDSMYPLLKSGDIVIYKKLIDIIDNIFWGEMYIVSIDMDGEEFISVKFVQKSERGGLFIKLVSQNKHHQDKDVHLEKVRAMALVKASVRINSMS